MADNVTTEDPDFPKPFGYDAAVQDQKDAQKDVQENKVYEIEPVSVVAVDPHTPTGKVVAPAPDPHDKFWYDPTASDAERKAQEIARNDDVGAIPAVVDAKIAADADVEDPKDENEVSKDKDKENK